jgi:hypothetical protein
LKGPVLLQAGSEQVISFLIVANGTSSEVEEEVGSWSLWCPEKQISWAIQGAYSCWEVR